MSTSKEREWAIDERRLQPAYAGKLKSADALIRSHLKKKPTSQPALALKLYIAEKFTSHDSDSVASRKAVAAAYEEVTKTGELTSRSLWWVGMGLRNAGRSDLALSMYQSAWKLHPDDSELGEQVFLHATSVWNTEVMISASRKMFNTNKGVWGRVSAWAEWAVKSTPPSPLRPFPPPRDASELKAALILLSTTVKALPTPDVLWLHLQIFLAAGMEEEALELVRRDTSSPTPSVGVGANGANEQSQQGGEAGVGRAYWRVMAVQEIHRRRHSQALVLDVPRGEEHQAEEKKGVLDGEGLKKLWEAEWNWALSQIQHDRISNYLLYRHFLQATIALLLSTQTIIEDARKHLESLDQSIGNKERAPLLALIELQSLLRLNEFEENMISSAEFKDQIRTYWERWGSKGCVVEDLRWLLKEEELDVSDCRTSHSNLDSFLRLVNAEKWVAWNTAEVTLDEALRIWKLYLDGLQYGANLPKTDIQPADELGFVAIEHLLRLHALEGDEAHLVRAVLCLRYMVRKSPSQMRGHFLLIRLFRLIGAPSLVASSITKLDPQEIQLDTLLHCFTQRCGDVLLGQTNSVLQSYVKKAAAMYKRSAVDLPQYVKQALQHESYSKIQGLRILSNNLRTSLSQYALAIEETRLKILQDGILEIPPILEKLPVEFSDSRDWDLLPHTTGDIVRQATRLGNEEEDMTGDWVRVWAKVLQGVAKWHNGQTVEAIQVPDRVGGLIPAERCFLETIASLLQAITKRSLSEASIDNSPNSMSNVFEGSIQCCLVDTPSRRWDVLYPCLVLVELRRIVDLMLKRMQDLIKPKKGRKTSAGLLALIEEVKAAQAKCAAGVEEVLKHLEALEGQDKEMRTGVSSDSFFADDDEVGKDVEEVLEARQTALANLRTLLKS